MLFEDISYKEILEYLSRQIFNSVSNINIDKFKNIDERFKKDWYEYNEITDFTTKVGWPGLFDTWWTHRYFGWNRGWVYEGWKSGRLKENSGVKPSYTIKQNNKFFIKYCEISESNIYNNMTMCYELYINRSRSFDFNRKIYNANEFLFFLEFILLYFESSLKLYTSMLSNQCHLVYTLINFVDTSRIHKIPNDRKVNNDFINLVETIGDSSSSIDGVLNTLWIILQNKVAYIACEYEITDSRDIASSYSVMIKQTTETKELEEEIAEILGGGIYSKGSQVNIEILNTEVGFIFQYYQDQNGKKYMSSSYSFIINSDVFLTAFFKEATEYTLTYQDPSEKNGKSVTNKISKVYKLLSLKELKDVPGFNKRKDNDDILQWSTSPDYIYDKKRYPNQAETFFAENLTIYPFYKNDNNLAVVYQTQNKVVDSILDCIIKNDKTECQVRDLNWLKKYSGIDTQDLYPESESKLLDYWKIENSGKEYKLYPGVSAYSNLTSYMTWIKNTLNISLSPVFK